MRANGGDFFSVDTGFFKLMVNKAPTPGAFDNVREPQQFSNNEQYGGNRNRRVNKLHGNLWEADHANVLENQHDLVAGKPQENEEPDSDSFS